LIEAHRHDAFRHDLETIAKMISGLISGMEKGGDQGRENVPTGPEVDYTRQNVP
jgi:hypothetical protein